MDALLLCAGFGTRLKPLTNYLPKCLAPIGDIPLLAVWLHQLSKLSFISKVYINTHYHADQVKDFLNSNEFGINISLIEEESLLGTSGSISNALKISSSNEFMIIHGDNLSLQDFSVMHSEFQNAISIDPSLGGVALGFESDNFNECGFYTCSHATKKINSFIEKPGYPVNGLANGAILMLTRKALTKALNSSKGIDFCKDNLPEIIKELILFKAGGIHIDIGSPSKLHMAQQYTSTLDGIILNKLWKKSYVEKVSQHF